MARITLKNFLKCSFIIGLVTIFPPRQCELENEVCRTIPKLGQCPTLLTNTPEGETCVNHSDCPGNLLCCGSVFGENRCSSPKDSKTGDCSSIISESHYGKKCFLDSDCEGTRKCCPKTSCDYYCQDIINEKYSPNLNSQHYLYRYRKSFEPRERVKRQATCSMIEKYGTCPSVLINPGVYNCFVNENCSGKRVCCSDGTGARKCSDPATTRSGTCPPPGSLIVKGGSNCYVDENCGAGRKCCQETPCSFFCSNVLNPVTVSPTINPACYSIPKYGTCPPNLVKPGTTTCFIDDNCSGNRKCCPDATGTRRCSDPLQTRTGNCPPAGQLLNKGLSQCYVDENCGAPRRCCQETPCSYFCSDVSPNVITPTPACFNIPKYGTCPPTLINKGSSPCFSSDNCSGNRICCLDVSVGTRFCTDPQRIKPGNCPLPGSLLTPGATNCYIDENCTGNRLCCQQTACSYFCSDPIIPSTTTTTPSVPLTGGTFTVLPPVPTTIMRR